MRLEYVLALAESMCSSLSWEKHISRSGVDRGGTGPAVLLVTWPVGCLLNPVRYVLGKAALFWEVLSQAGRRLGFIFHSDTVMERMSLSAPCPCAQNKGVTINSFILFG